MGYKKVLVDVEIISNNKPMGYVEDDVQLPVLMTNSLMSNSIPRYSRGRCSNTDDQNLWKRVKYLKQCNENMEKMAG